ncbi:hypothetical protein IJJ02_03595 [Candidatus Saccharibacteria bacterium]|nr:hypothetical protein [Candidatus Saccharibacteria bacterium]
MENESTNAFTIMPMNQKISLNPGEVYEGYITIINPSYATEDFVYKAEVTPYSVADEEYTADLLSESDRTAISKWITIEEPTGSVKPNESKEIKFTIKVPQNAPAGGQYGTIAVSSNQDSSNANGVSVQNVFEIASIIYADVAGETVHDGEILENNVPSFVLNNPVKITAMLTNKGNVHETAIFTITVSDVFTGRVILPTEENTGRYSEVIMPETTRYAEREVSDLPALGVVKVTQTIDYNGQTSTTEKQIIICPVWFMALVLLTLASIIAAVVIIVKKRHRKGIVV